ncbi:hypothetical protein ABID39_001053 [Bartonella japonica]|uniref:Uncharacterized protein n=1 Tax=Bartonella japonica TaxID=357761 RepID=A0ABV2FP73_9HYPH
MNIRYFFAICAVILSISFGVKASERAVFQEEASIIVVYTVCTTNIVIDDEVDSLLNKVIIPAYPGDHDIFWKSLAPIFQKIKRIYIDLGSYLYASIFSIFRW